MLTPKDIKIIKTEAAEFFKKTSFEMDVEFGVPEEMTMPINLQTSEPQILIGERGQTLSDIQHLLRALLRKKIVEPFYINLDINNYKKKKAEYLKEMARSVADEVSLVKKEKDLPPMPAYERRLIHMELASREDIISESTGEGQDRRIVVRPR